jgi:hypothetical protein
VSNESSSETNGIIMAKTENDFSFCSSPILFYLCTAPQRCRFISAVLCFYFFISSVFSTPANISDIFGGQV